MSHIEDIIINHHCCNDVANSPQKAPKLHTSKTKNRIPSSGGFEMIVVPNVKMTERSRRSESEPNTVVKRTKRECG